jgi:hypothetical protein
MPFGFRCGFVCPKVDLLVFHNAAESFDHHSVAPTTFAIHADLNPMTFEHFRELQTSKLAALIGVDDFRLAVFDDCFLNRFNAEIFMHGVRQPLTEHFPAEPINDCAEIQ